MRAYFSIAVLGVFLAAPVASLRAQEAPDNRVVILPVRGVPSPLPDEDIALVERGLRDLLEEGGSTVLGPRDVATAMTGSPSANCTEVSCARDVAAAVRATYVIAAKVLVRDGTLTHLRVTLVDASGVQSEVQEAIRSRSGLPAATRTALSRALAYRALNGTDTATRSSADDGIEIAAILAVRGGDGRDVPTEVAQRTERALADSLLARGVTVHNIERTTSQLTGTDIRACREPACATRVAERTGVDYVVIGTVWIQRGFGVTGVRVTLSDPLGSTDSTDAIVRNPVSLEQATDRALAEVLSAHTESRVGALHVTASHNGQPVADAQVNIDGTSTAPVPVDRPIAPGAHRILVRHPRYRTAEQFVSISPRERATVDVVLATRAEHAATHAEESARSAPAAATSTTTVHEEVGPWIVGSVGVAAIGFGIFGLVWEGDCVVRNASGSCGGRDRINEGLAGASLGIGIAAVGSAVLWYALSGHEVAAEQPMASVGIGVGSLRIEGSF